MVLKCHPRLGLRVDGGVQAVCNGVLRLKVLMPRQATIPTAAAAPKPVVKEKDRDPIAAGMRDAAFNRSAGHNYFLTDRVEAGWRCAGPR